MLLSAIGIFKKMMDMSYIKYFDKYKLAIY